MINMYDLAKKILAETDGQICKHCLGRKLSHIVDGRDNINRGEKIFEDLEIPEPEECVICGNIFDKIKSVVRKPEPEPTRPKATKISDVKLTDDSKHKTFTLNDEIKK